MARSQLENLVLQSLEELYAQRLKRLNGLELSEFLRDKNFHLLCVVHDPDFIDMLEELLKTNVFADDIQTLGDTFSQSLSRIAAETSIAEVDLACQAITIIHEMGRIIPVYEEFAKEWDNAMNRFTHEFLINFCKQDGSIDLVKLVRYSSHEENEPWITREMHLANAVYESIEVDEDYVFGEHFEAY